MPLGVRSALSSPDRGAVTGVVCFGDWLMGDGCSEMTHVSGVTSGLAGNCLPVPSLDFTLSTGGDIR